MISINLFLSKEILPYTYLCGVIPQIRDNNDIKEFKRVYKFENIKSGEYIYNRIDNINAVLNLSKLEFFNSNYLIIEFEKETLFYYVIDRKILQNNVIQFTLKLDCTTTYFSKIKTDKNFLVERLNYDWTKEKELYLQTLKQKDNMFGNIIKDNAHYLSNNTKLEVEPYLYSNFASNEIDKLKDIKKAKYLEGYVIRSENSETLSLDKNLTGQDNNQQIYKFVMPKIENIITYTKNKSGNITNWEWSYEVGDPFVHFLSENNRGAWTFDCAYPYKINITATLSSGEKVNYLRKKDNKYYKRKEHYIVDNQEIIAIHRTSTDIQAKLVKLFKQYFKEQADKDIKAEFDNYVANIKATKPTLLDNNNIQEAGYLVYNPKISCNEEFNIENEEIDLPLLPEIIDFYVCVWTGQSYKIDNYLNIIDNKVKFNVYGYPTIDSIKAYISFNKRDSVKNDFNLLNNEQLEINYSKDITIRYDSKTEYLRANANQIERQKKSLTDNLILNTVSSFVSFVSNIVSQNYGGAIKNVIGAVGNGVNYYNSMQMIEDRITDIGNSRSRFNGGTSGDILYIEENNLSFFDKNGFMLYYKMPRDSLKETIKNAIKKHGLKLNLYTNFNNVFEYTKDKSFCYVKTNDIDNTLINSNIPYEVMFLIKDHFNSGVHIFKFDDNHKVIDFYA